MQLILRQYSGMGNQLFQYAAGLYYSKRYGAPMKVVRDHPKRLQSYGYPRPFMLSHFSITSPVRDLTLFERLIFSPRANLSALRQAFGIQIFFEPLDQRFTFLEAVPLHQRTRVLYLYGLWQTFRMVEEVADQVRSELTVRKPPRVKDLLVLERIQRSKYPISLHVRRGDYTLAAEGQIALPMDYYVRAISIFKERFDNPTFFVFSDDPVFVRKNLLFDADAVFVDHNDSLTAHEDLRLMAACHHHIIANSTFSWWGAWLNPRSDKIVVAPKHWRLTANSYFPELLPPSWILLDTAAPGKV